MVMGKNVIWAMAEGTHSLLMITERGSPLTMQILSIDGAIAWIRYSAQMIAGRGSSLTIQRLSIVEAIA